MTTPALDLNAHTGRRYDKKRSVVWLVLWHVVSHLVFQKWWFPARLRPAVLRVFGATVGAGVLIRQNVRIHLPWRLHIAGPAWIGHGAWLLNLEDVVIGPNACISQEAMLCTGSHDRKDPAFEHTNAPIRIGASAWICARATVLAGCTVGDNAIVTAGTVVSGSVDSSTIVSSS